MAKVKIKFNFGIKDLLTGRSFVKKKTAQQIGSGVIRRMKQHMNKGLSPVRKARRFSKYATSYKKQIKGGLKRGKSISPVNLKLSGELQDAIKWEQTSEGTVKVGVSSQKKVSGSKITLVDLAEIHNDGTNPDIPQRKFIPDKKGEEFTVTIQDFIKSVYESRLRDIIKRSNRQ